LLLHYSPSSDSFQFGILVPKRFAKRAVCRNALKRIFREACREKAKTFSTGRILVRLTRPAPPVRPADKAIWWKEIRQLLNALSPD
jgi:ribonuclease P protein component